MPKADITSPPAALTSSLRHLLRPLIRLLISRGIGYPYLADMLKGIFVQVAEESFRLPDKPQTDSRISLLTGVHRKDVKRLRSSGDEEYQPKASPPLSAQLIAHWTGDPRYLDDQGRPRPLARLATSDSEHSFEALITSISKDIRPRAILDECLRQGIAELDAEDRVHLLTDAFVPKAGQDEKNYYFGHNLHDHMAAGVHNLLGGQPPLLERNVYYDRLSPESVAALQTLSREQGMQALQTINRAALERQERDNDRPDTDQRMSFGVYFYTPQAEQSDDDVA